MNYGNGLPKGWAVVPLGSAGTWHGGGTPSKFNDAFWSNGRIPWISPKDMKVLRISDSEDHISIAALAQTNVKAFPPGTVLVVIRSGILSRTLPVAVADVQATMNQDLKGIYPHDSIDSMYLAYFLRSEEHEILRRCSKNGTTVASIDTNALHAYPCKIGPLNEQRRIVAKIDELFSDLDAGVAALDRVKVKLKRYRAAVLKAAVEGKLTADWRKNNQPKETGRQFLDRILQERRRKWEEEQLASYDKAEKKPPAGWKDKYKGPAGPGESSLPELPEGWCWAHLNQVAFFQNGRAFPSKEYTSDGTKLLRPGNLFDDGTIRWTDKNTRCMPSSWAETYPEHVVLGDELIMNLTAQSLRDEFLGRTCVTNRDGVCLLNQRLARITPLDGCDRRYLLYLLKSSVFRRFVNTLNTGSLIQHMFTSQLDDFNLPLPPQEEQIAIVTEIERRLSLVDFIQQQMGSNLKRSARLRQSILKRAFEGKLVPQDPSDEPASVLLERIKATKENGSPKTTKPARMTK